jgi:hypothetical protein
VFQDSYYVIPTHVVEITLLQFSSLGTGWCENQGHGQSSYVWCHITSTVQAQVSFLFQIQHISVCHYYCFTSLPGARPPPLLRRSSFPVHIEVAASIIRHSFTPKEHTKTPSGAATPTKATPRRTSMDLSEDDSSPEMAKRRVRFLRRHWSFNKTC